MATNTDKTAVVATVAAAAAVAAVTASKVGSLNAGPPIGIDDATAARFLTQATFGPSDASITEMKNLGFTNWINAQIAKPFATETDAPSKPFPKTRGLAYKEIRQRDSSDQPFQTDYIAAFYERFWTKAIKADDQLRRRMQFALSQIFVVSFQNNQIFEHGFEGMGNYFEELARQAFGNWRELLEFVAISPVTGVFLTFVSNQKENPATGRTPDENFAREMMQLYALGTVLLNMDGTPVLDGAGVPIPTYTSADIKGMAKVLTGIGHRSSFFGGGLDWVDARDDRTGQLTGRPVEMVFYDDQHSLSEKKFLGVTIPATTRGATAAELKILLDTIFNHQNTAPFFAKRLIQQFVTSNPTPNYVERVAKVFVNNGAGVRGDMGAVIRAVLLDTEARDTAAAHANPNFGKLREPVIRLTNWARAFNAESFIGTFPLDQLDRAGRLSQSPMNAPSVFNFWRATFVPPGAQSRLGAQGLVAPEFQLVNELTTAQYANFMRSMIFNGVGFGFYNGGDFLHDVKSQYVAERALAHDANALVERMSMLFFSGRISPDLKARIVAAVNSFTVPQSGITDAIRTRRAKVAILLSMASGEYLAQR